MAGITTINTSDGDTRRLILREHNYAAGNFGISGTSNYNYRTSSIVPKPKFLFFAKLVLDPLYTTSIATNGLSAGDPTQGIVFQVRQIDKPSFTIRSEPLNQYNKTRNVQTKILFQPINITYHDDVADKVLSFWNTYYTFYYGEGRQSSSSNWSWDVYSNAFNEGNNAGWGYKGIFQGNVNDNAQLINRIDIYQFYGGYYNKIQVIRPKITAMSHDPSDYSDGREGTSIRMTLEHEGVIYFVGKENATPVMTNGSINPEAEQFNFQNDWYNPPGSDSAVNSISSKTFTPSTSAPPATQITDPPQSGRTQLVNQLAQATPITFAGATALDGSGFNFGSGALSQITGTVADLVTLTSLSGQTPSTDLVQKATGVKTSIDNFGTYVNPSTGRVLSNASNNPNKGIDSIKVDQAASILNTSDSSADAIEEDLGNGQSRILDRSTATEFSRALGTAAAIATNEGIITTVANYTDNIDQNAVQSPALVNKTTSGTYQLTNIGSAVMNAVRSPDSFLGTRNLVNNSSNDPSDINRKALSLETKK